MTQNKPCIKVAWLTEMTEPQETKQWEAPWDRVLAEVCTVQPHGGQSVSIKSANAQTFQVSNATSKDFSYIQGIAFQHYL